MLFQPHLNTRLRQQSPLVCALTNIVTVNDVANALYAIGAKPSMPRAAAEAESYAQKAAALLINIGSLDETLAQTYLRYAAAASHAHCPIIIDPVGVGHSPWRYQLLKALLDTCQPSLIRGNISEIQALLKGGESGTIGVDVSPQEARLPGSEKLAIANALSQKLHCHVIITGPSDYIATAQGEKASLQAGAPLLSQITGAGCMLSGILAAYLAVENSLEALLTGLSHLAVASERAAQKAAGPGTFHAQLFDALYHFDAQPLELNVTHY